MIGYRYDSDGYLIGETRVDENPFSPGEYFVPPNTTTTEPPSPGANQIPKYSISLGTWSLAPNFSGVPYYKKSDKSVKFFEVGEAFDEDYTSVAPPSPDYSYIVWNEMSGAWVEDANLKKDFKIQQNKNKAKSLIAQYDWINDTTTTPKLLNKDDFYAYRSALRLLILNPVENPVWPEVPQEVWDAN